MLRLAPCLVALLVVSPAAAQSVSPFAAALNQFAIALIGSYGDEGAQVARALDAMAHALPDWDHERAALEQRAHAAPADRQAHVDLARAFVQRGRTDEAIRELDAAVRVNPPALEPSLLLGVARLNAGHAADAAAAFRDAWRRDRTSPVAAYWFLRTDADAPHDDIAAAIDVLSEVVHTALTHKRTDAALPFATFPAPPADVGDAPLLLPAAYAKGYAQLLAGDPAAAVAAFRDAARTDPLTSDPALGSPAMTAGTAALRQGRIAVAREHFRAAIAQSPQSSEAHRLLALASLFDFDPEASIAELQAAIRVRPDDERSIVLLSRVMTQQGDLANAATMLGAALTALPESSLVRLWLGSVMASSNRDDEAARLMTEVAMRHPLAGEARLWATIGTLRQNAGDVDAAADAFERSIALNPNVTETHVRAARVLLDQDKRDRAFAEYVAALLVDPAEPNALMGIGRLRVDAGRYADALPVLQRLVALQPAFNEAHYALGTALTRVGRTDEGTRELAEFTRAQAQATERRRRTLAVDVLKQEALVRTSEGDFDRAEAVWKEILALEPNVAADHAELAAVLLRANRLDGAAAAYEKAAALGAGPDVYRQLAAVYARLGRQAESAAARQKFEQALALPANGAAR
jgi:tetratricopeptide (TPR) repeat protein